MEFWGVEVKPGQTVKCHPGDDKYLHLSQASLGETKKDKGNVPVPLFVKVDGKKLVIGTLSPDRCAQITYDLVFEKEFELSHSWKDGSVFFVGYKTIVADDEPVDFSDSGSESEEEELPAAPKGNASAKVVPAAPASQGAPKVNAKASKAKPKAKETAKPEKDDEDDDVESDGDEDEDDSEDASDEDMILGEDNSDDDDDEEDEKENSDEEEKVTPKKAESGKKRPAGSESKTSVTDKKAKLVTPAGKMGKDGGQDGKKGGHTATPYPNKQAVKTSGNDDKSKQQTPKSGGAFSCKSCSKTFNSDNALQSHSKAKHAAK